jgi:hypothetical protein
LTAVATIGAPQPEALQRLFAHRLNPSHNPSPSQLRKLFEDAGFRVVDQHRVRRPLWTQVLSDLITVGVKA